MGMGGDVVDDRDPNQPLGACWLIGETASNPAVVRNEVSPCQSSQGVRGAVGTAALVLQTGHLRRGTQKQE